MVVFIRGAYETDRKHRKSVADTSVSYVGRKAGYRGGATADAPAAEAANWVHSLAMDLARRPASSPDRTTCKHIPATMPTPRADRCQECGSTWNLRLCATCGHVGCCESQQGDARAHALNANHPIIYQMPAESGFIWCYAEGRYVG